MHNTDAFLGCQSTALYHQQTNPSLQQLHSKHHDHCCFTTTIIILFHNLQCEIKARLQDFARISNRACLDQLLIAIRSFTLLCDQSRSQARLIAIMKLLAKLGIIYATACHNSLCTTALDCLSVSCHCRRTALTTVYKHGMARGRWGLGRQLQQQLALWVCLK